MKDSGTRNRFVTLAAILVTVMFSWFLMTHTLAYDASRSEIKIASKLWSDFGAHIPLVRSFSQGANMNRLFTAHPVESPLFPGEPIRYHFGFYAIAGLLERLGLRIDWAINIPSIIGLSMLLVFIFLLSGRLFNNNWVSFLSVIFFLCNGSLAFASFFSNHPLSVATPLDIINNSVFPAFGPWDSGNITAFWTLNIYTNQRHLALSYGLLLGLLYILYKPARISWRTGVIAGAIASILLFINFAAAGIAALLLFWIFISQKKLRLPLLVTAGMGLITFAAMNSASNVTSDIAWQPGYLVSETLTPLTFIKFWIENIGLHITLIPLGLLLAPKEVKRYVAPPLLTLFIIPNLYRFSPDMINNHKFFNFFMLIGNMFTAYAVVRILTLIKKIPAARCIKPIQLIAGIILISLLTLSGIIDFFPVLNDRMGNVADNPMSADAQFFAANTKTTDIVANTTWFYHPASIAGRSLFSGYTYFTWSYGYDQVSREFSLKQIYEAASVADACKALEASNVAWIELNPNPESYLHPNWDVWNSFTPQYTNPVSLLKVYKTDDICTYAGI